MTENFEPGEGKVPQEYTLTRRGFLWRAPLAGAALFLASYSRTAHAERVDQGGFLGINDLRGTLVVSAPGVPTDVRGGSFDLADHGIFRNSWPMEPKHPNPLKNVLGEPGGFLADRDLIVAQEPQNLADWDAKVARGEAEYIRRGGPDINFYNLEDHIGGPGWSHVDGHWRFDLVLPKHVIVRIDEEEGWTRVISGSGDRNVLIDLYQAGTAANQQPRAHHTLFIRTHYEQECSLTLDMPTVPGTQLQILGMKVARHIAFASSEAALQGVGPRQDRLDVPRYMVHTANINDLTFGSVESPEPGQLFHHLGNNYGA